VLRRITGRTGSGSVRASGGPRPLFALILMVFALFSSACASSGSTAGGATAASPKVTELRSVAELKDRFNEDAGKVRLILLISPT